MSKDASNLPELTRRQEEILSLIIRTYSGKSEPVSSKYLVDTFDLNVSSATIRNEMAVLEDMGYIAAPHKSAGRIPTENGYRYFVTRLISNGDLTTAEQQRITSRFKSMPVAAEQWIRFAATALSRATRTASLVTTPTAETGRFKHLELISIQGRLVLMVLVLRAGTVQQRMLNLEEPVPQPKLSEAAERINKLCDDLTANEMLLKSVSLSMLEREVVELAAEVMQTMGGTQGRVVYREGLSDVINTFSDNEGAQQAVRVFEERAFLNMILDEFINPLADDVQVIIAGDGHVELNQLSLVLTRYGIPGKISGALGVLGPTHINYGRAISTVRYVSSTMTNMLVGLYQNDDEGEGVERDVIVQDEDPDDENA